MLAFAKTERFVMAKLDKFTHVSDIAVFLQSDDGPLKDLTRAISFSGWVSLPLFNGWTWIPYLMEWKNV